MATQAAISGLQAQRTSQLEGLKDASSTEVSVTSTSATLATLLSAALPDNVLGVTVIPGSNLIRYNPVGTASSSNASLPTIFSIYGSKAVLDTAQFQSASTLAMGVIVHIPA